MIAKRIMITSQKHTQLENNFQFLVKCYKNNYLDLQIVLFIISWGVIFFTKLCHNILSVNTSIVII